MKKLLLILLCLTGLAGPAMAGSDFASLIYLQTYESLQFPFTNNGTTVFGYGSLNYWMTSPQSDCTYFGATIAGEAGYSVANTAMGALSLQDDYATTNQVSVGFASLQNDITGSYNTAVGAYALQNATNVNNIAIGYQAGDLLKYGKNNIYLGNQGFTNDNGTVYIGTVGLHSNCLCAPALVGPFTNDALPNFGSNQFYQTVGTGWTNGAQRGFFKIPFSYSTGSGTGWGVTCYVTNYSGPLNVLSTITNVETISMGAAGLTALTEAGSNYFSGFVYSNSSVLLTQNVGTITAINVTNNQSHISFQ